MPAVAQQYGYDAYCRRLPPSGYMMMSQPVSQSCLYQRAMATRAAETERKRREAAARAARVVASAEAADGIYICAEHTDQADWADEFSRGSVVVPAGTVLDYAGHLMGASLQDPKGEAAEL